MRRVALTFGPLIAALLGAGIGCKDKPADAPPPAPPPPPPPHDGVRVQAPGAAPIQTLRYHLTKGDRTASELVWDFDARTDGKSEPLPTLVLDLETTVADVLANGTARLQIRVARTAVRSRAGATGSELMTSEAAAMQGVIITELLAPDGQLSGAAVDAAASVPASVRERLAGLSHSLEQAAMRLPADPVGAGAQWHERRTLPEGGIRAVADTTYTLTALTGTQVDYTAKATSSGAPQTLEQDGLKVEVTNTHGHAEATGTVDLAHYAPRVRAASSFATAMNVDAPRGTPGAGASTIEIVMAIQMTPLTGDAAAALAAPGDAGVPATGAADTAPHDDHEHGDHAP